MTNFSRIWHKAKQKTLKIHGVSHFRCPHGFNHLFVCFPNASVYPYGHGEHSNLCTDDNPGSRPNLWSYEEATLATVPPPCPAHVLNFINTGNFHMDNVKFQRILITEKKSFCQGYLLKLVLHWLQNALFINYRELFSKFDETSRN